MDCFEVQHQMTELIDGVLSPSQRDFVEAHLDSCGVCTEHFDRAKALILLMHDQPRIPLPLDIRAHPLSFSLTERVARKNLRAHWHSMPTAVRLLAEAVSIAGVIFLGIHMGPKIRGIYDRQMEKKLQNMIAAEDLSSEVPLERGHVSDDARTAEEYNSEKEGDDTTDDPQVIQVGKAEIWRFNLKTDSPALVRGKIIALFTENGIPPKTAGFSGTEAPGGIQFDLLVPQSLIPVLKAQLEKLAAPAANAEGSDVKTAGPAGGTTKATTGPFSENFTWYKNRSKKPIPAGKSRAVIWLSQS